MKENPLMKRLGIARIALKKDLICFFIPWVAAMLLEFILCGVDGTGLSDFWRNLWALISDPRNVVSFPVRRTMGTLLFVIGLTTMIVGQLTLQRNYSGLVLIRKDHRLITHGVYRFIRNPIYLGAIIVFTSLPIYADSRYGMLAMFLMLPLFLMRIKLEEELLTQYFGREYEVYYEQTKRLIPFLF